MVCNRHKYRFHRDRMLYLPEKMTGIIKELQFPLAGNPLWVCMLPTISRFIPPQAKVNGFAKDGKEALKLAHQTQLHVPRLDMRISDLRAINYSNRSKRDWISAEEIQEQQKCRFPAPAS